MPPAHLPTDRPGGLPLPTTPDAVLAEEQRRAEEVYDRLIRPALRPEDVAPVGWDG